MKLTIDEALAIIEELEDYFSSHEFIEGYAYHHEEEYINMLCEHKGDKAFQKVHAQLARFLIEHKDELRILKMPRKGSVNVFGNITEVQFWQKK